MAIPESQVKYIPSELRDLIIASLTKAQLGRIKEYCQLKKVTAVTVKASHIGGHSEIYIKNSLGQGAATPLSAESQLSQKLELKAIG